MKDDMRTTKEHEYLEILDSSIEGTFINDLEKGEIYFSTKWKNRLGIGHLTPAEAAQAIFTMVHPDDVENIYSIYSKACKERSPKVKMEFRAKTVDSGYIWILGQGKIIYNSEGKPIKYYGTHIDITDRKRLEEALKRSVKAQDEIFANVSHELKTPLNVIFSAVQLIESRIKGGPNEDCKKKVLKSINIIKQNCFRFTKLINNILDLSKIESGFFMVDLSNNNIVDIVGNIVQSVSEFVQEKGLELIFNTECKEKIIACDPDLLERVLLNLISNGVKFSNTNSKIEVALTNEGEYVQVSVKDYGIGIEEKYFDIIFERFGQVDKTLTRNAEGAGIGLSLVKSIVEMHGGKISVESRLGVGSTFKIKLPDRKAESQQDSNKGKLHNREQMVSIEFSDI